MWNVKTVQFKSRSDMVATGYGSRYNQKATDWTGSRVDTRLYLVNVTLSFIGNNVNMPTKAAV